MTLGELIDALGQLNPRAEVRVAGRPRAAFESYRGIYDHLALVPQNGAPMTVRELLRAALEADGGTFMGYKGGQYKMDRDTPVWVAESGCTGDALVGVLVKPGHVEIARAVRVCDVLAEALATVEAPTLEEAASRALARLREREEATR